MYVAKGATPRFLKGLENTERGPLLFPSVLVILANYWKMTVPPDQLFNNTKIRNNLIALCNSPSKMFITYSQDMALTSDIGFFLFLNASLLEMLDLFPTECNT